MAANLLGGVNSKSARQAADLRCGDDYGISWCRREGTANGKAMVRNALIQQDSTRVRCTVWREQAERLVDVTENECVLLYQLLIFRKAESAS